MPPRLHSSRARISCRHGKYLSESLALLLREFTGHFNLEIQHEIAFARGEIVFRHSFPWHSPYLPMLCGALPHHGHYMPIHMFHRPFKSQ